jgi:hypothetical protein
VADREIKAKLRVEMAPDEKRKLDDLAKATRGAADAQREYAGAMKDTAAAAKDTAAAVDRLAAHPGAAKFGLTRDVLAKMPPAALSDMARQLGVSGPAAAGGGIFSAAGNFFNRGGGIFGAAPVNWSPYQSPGPQPPPGPPPTSPWGRPVLGGNISDTAHMGFAVSPGQRSRLDARLGGMGDFDLTPGGPTAPPPWWNPALTSKATDAQFAGLRANAAGGAAAAMGALKYVGGTADAYYAPQEVAATGGTGMEATRAFADSNWVLRNTLGQGKDLADSITGRGFKLRENERRQVERRIRNEGEERIRQQQNQVDIEAGRLARSVQAQGRIGPLATVSQFDRSTVGGDIAFQEASRLQGARNQAEQARVDYEASVAHAGDLSRGREALGRRKQDLEGEALGYQLKAGTAREGPDRDRLLKLEADAREKLKQAIDEEQKIVAQEKQARMDSVQALKAQRDAQLQVTQAELQNLQARERVAAGQAQGLGQMIPFERAAAVQGAMMVKEMGWDAASPEMRDQLRRVAPRTAEKMAEDAGKNSPEAEFLRQQFPEEHRDRLDDIRKQAPGKQDEVQVQMRVNVEEIKKATKQAVESVDLQTAIRDLVRAEVSNEIAKVKNGLQQRNVVGK